MGEKNAGTDFLEQLCHRIRHDLHIERPCVRRHRAEVLVQRFRIAGELHAVEIVRPGADAKLVEPELLVRCRLHCCLGHAPPGAAPARLVDEIGGEASTQEDVLEAFAAIGSRLPGLGELSGIVPHHDRVLTRVCRHLIEGKGMIAVIGLACGIERFSGSKVPGAAVLLPPMAKLPCSWMTNGSGFTASAAVANGAASCDEASSNAARVLDNPYRMSASRFVLDGEKVAASDGED